MLRHAPRLLGTVLLLAAVLAAVGSPPAPAEAQAALTWTPRTSGTTNILFGVACPSATACVAVGGGGTIVTGNPTNAAAP